MSTDPSLAIPVSPARAALATKKVRVYVERRLTLH